MARQIEGPWYRSGKDAWYATVQGRSVSLRVKGRDSKHTAQRAWHRLMAGDMPEPSPKPEPSLSLAPALAEVQPITVAEVVGRYLADAEQRVKPTTLAVLGFRLRPFADKHGSVKADALMEEVVRQWLRSRNLSQSSRHGIIGCVKSCFAWAERKGIIPANPLRHLERPACQSRGAKAVISDADHQKLTASASPALKPLLTLLRETGARPSELARLTADDVDFANAVAVLAEHKTASHGKPRLIVLTPTAASLLQELADRRPIGALLRNAYGVPWTKDAICQAMRALCHKAGVKAVAYGYRHSFATDALASGVPDATVAALLGHSSTSMLHKHYSHLTARTAVLREAVAKVRGFGRAAS